MKSFHSVELRLIILGPLYWVNREDLESDAPQVYQ